MVTLEKLNFDNAKTIKGCHPKYRIFENGDILNINVGKDGLHKKTKAYCNKAGYYQVSLMSENESFSKHYLHRLLAAAFIENPEAKPCVNHKNGIKGDNRIENLEWVTHRENELHAYEIGLMKAHWKGKPGFLNPSSKAVVAFFGDQSIIFGSISSAASALGIAQSHVSRVISGEITHARLWTFKLLEDVK